MGADRIITGSAHRGRARSRARAAAITASVLCAVTNSGRTLLLRAMSAAIDFAGLLDAVADDSATTMSAGWCHRVNSAFEAVKGHCPAILSNSESLIILVATMITSRHFRNPLNAVRWNAVEDLAKPDSSIVPLKTAGRGKFPCTAVIL